MMRGLLLINKIKELLDKNDLELIFSNYSIEDICSCLNFNEAMYVVEYLFYDDIQNDEKQQYALKLLLKIKDRFSQEWESDWKNDVFLGNICEILWLYDERYFFL